MSAGTIANLDFIKERNISTVFRTIVEMGPISRVQIARLCQLAAGSVTKITRQLINAGLIREVEQQITERGRPAISLVAQVEEVQILVINASRQHLQYSLCDLMGGVLAEHSEPFTASDQAEYVRQIISGLKSFQNRFSMNTRHLMGIGVTTPGLVNSTTGVVHYLPHMSVENFTLSNSITEATGLPCYLNNFTSAMTLAEHLLGVSKHCSNSVMVSVHNGIGSGMILDGKLYEGSALAAGEIGHIQIDPLGQRCYCGNFGCLEMLVSNRAIERYCQQQLRAGIASVLDERSDINDICQAALEGDHLAVELLKKAASDLGKVIAMTVNLLSPDQVVLAGEICRAADIVFPVIRHCLRSQTVSFVNAPEVSVVKSELHNQRWLGGYALVRKALLEDGLLWETLKQKAL